MKRSIVIIGTSGVVLAFTDRPVTNPEGGVQTFCHAVPGKWHVMGVVLAAGGSFQWFRNTLGAPECARAKKRMLSTGPCSPPQPARPQRSNTRRAEGWARKRSGSIMWGSRIDDLGDSV